MRSMNDHARTASQGTRRIAAAALLGGLGLFFGGTACRGSGDSPRHDYRTEIEPILIEYCFDCHGDGMDKGGIALDEHDELKMVMSDVKLWDHVYSTVEGLLMPPGEKAQPTDEERQKIVEWIEADVFKLDPKNPDPGRVTIRRLNRDEYNNTVRDLVGIDLRPADEFPEDDTGYGFDTIGDVLTLSPALLERYFDAAGRVLNTAIVTEAPAPKVQNFEESKFHGRERIGDKTGHMSSSARVGVPLKNAEAGDYRIEVLAGGTQAKNEWPLMKVAVENGPQKDFRVDRPYSAPRWFPLEVKLKPGQRWLEVSFLNDLYDPKATDPKQRDRNLRAFRIKITGPLNRPIPAPTEAHKKLLTADTKAQSETNKARSVIGKFMRRAYRRPVQPAELDRLMTFYQEARKGERNFDQAVKLCFQVVMVSPKFLFRGEVQPDPDNAEAVHLIDEHALASRLSYFLWSSMPDAELMALADRGDLRKNLDKQIQRMLADKKIAALTSNFAGQWLQLRNLNLVSPDKKRFPAWNDGLRKAMRGESEHFFSGVVAENRSILEFIDADYSWLNQTMAKHYGVDGVEGDQFRKVAFKGPSGEQRGGLLTQASILTITSNPTRTSAVNRGNWVLENLLGTPPPPAPADVPALEESEPADEAEKLTLRQQLELHRADASCAACHARMDPLGFGLENFSAIGEWRDKESGLLIDASGELHTGEKFNGPAELRSILVNEKQEAIVRHLAETMLTYALGRGVEYYDKPAVGEISQAVAANDYKMHSLIRAVIESTPFQKRRGDQHAAEVAAMEAVTEP